MIEGEYESMEQTRWYKKGQELLAEIKQTKLGQDELAFWYIGQLGFIYKYQDTVIYIDPVLNDMVDSQGKTVRYYEIPFSPEQVEADYVFGTHGHDDHIAKETIRGIAKNDKHTKFIIPIGCKCILEECEVASERVVGMQDGKKYELGNMTITSFSAAHPEHVLDEDNPDMALGYCMQFGDKITVVHLGDTYLTQKVYESLKGLNTPNILFTPINGGDYFRTARNCIGNLEAEEAARLAIDLHADMTIPAHYDMIKGNTVNPWRFVETLHAEAPYAKFHLPVLGERFIYRV